MNKIRPKITPVIATVIIVAVAIAVAVAVAYWVTGIIPAFTRYEELKITGAYRRPHNSAIIYFKNIGTDTAKITDVLVNGETSNGTGWFLSDILIGSGHGDIILVFAEHYPIVTFECKYCEGITVTVCTEAGGKYQAYLTDD